MTESAETQGTKYLYCINHLNQVFRMRNLSIALLVFIGIVIPFTAKADIIYNYSENAHAGDEYLILGNDEPFILDGEQHYIYVDYCEEKNIFLLGFLFEEGREMPTEKMRKQGIDLLLGITLTNGEFFVIPYYDQAEGRYFFDLGAATYSSAVDEIGSGMWTAWGTLKYLNSRLVRYDIENMTLAVGERATGNVEEIITLNGLKGTARHLKDMYDAASLVIESDDFYTYSWE